MHWRCILGSMCLTKIYFDFVNIFLHLKLAENSFKHCVLLGFVPHNLQQEFVELLVGFYTTSEAVDMS